MTLELTFLVLTMFLAASLWIPYIVGVNMHLSSEVNPFQRPHNNEGLPDWVVRANRAHINLIEQSFPFAVLVILALVLNVSSPIIAWAAGIFFALRVAHAVGMISGVAQMPLRPIIFTAGWVCVLAIGVELFRLA